MRPLLLIVLLATLAVLTLRAARDSDDAIEVVEVEGNTPAVEASSEVTDTEMVESEVPTETAEESEKPTPGARRIVHVPGKAMDREDPPDLEADYVPIEHIEAYARHNLDLALNNDLDAAVRIDGVHNHCRHAPRSLEEVDRQVASRMEAYRRYREENPEFRGSDEVKAMEQAMALFRGCQFYREFFDGSLRAQLEHLANAGQPIARYLYAMWRPEIEGRTDAFFVMQEWTENATRYSLANLADGEPAGFLAFANAHGNMQSFAPSDWLLSFAFLLAAQECGYALPNSARLMRVFERQTESLYERDVRPDVLAMAEGLRGFCR